MTIKRARLGVENEAEGKSRVSRVSPFDLAPR